MNENPEALAIAGIHNLFGSEAVLTDTDYAMLWLEKKIEDMLKYDFNGLVNLLYRIDVYESKAKLCFGQPNQDIAKCLAALIWERQMQKAIRKLNP